MINLNNLITKAGALLAATALTWSAVTGVAWASTPSAVNANANANANECVDACFVLTSVTIQGVSAYALADLASTYDANLARRIRIDDLVQTATAITDRYRRDGYFLTRAVVAPSDHGDGSANIVVYEGYIGEISIRGNGANAVAPILRPLQQRRALTIGELERRLTLAADVPGIKLKSRIEPILDDPAQHRLVVEADLDRAEGGVYADNRGSEAQGPWQVYGYAAANSSLVAGDRFAASALTVPDLPKALTFGELSYTAPLGGGRQIRTSLSGYETNASSAGDDSWLKGKSAAVLVSLSQPIVRSRNRSLWAAASFDHRTVKQTFATSIGTFRETLSVARGQLSGRQKFRDGYVGGTVQISKGIDLFGATKTVSPGTTRENGTAVFSKTAVSAYVYRDLGRYVGVYGELAAQWSDDRLLASEAFSVGGPNFGRAYNYGEVTGDSGVAGSVELRLGWDPKPQALTFLQVFGYLDGGRVSNHLGASSVHADIASAGAGVRLTFQNSSTLKIELAKPLSGRPFNKQDSDPRLFVAISKEF